MRDVIVDKRFVEPVCNLFFSPFEHNFPCFFPALRRADIAPPANISYKFENLPLFDTVKTGLYCYFKKLGPERNLGGNTLKGFQSLPP